MPFVSTEAYVLRTYKLAEQDKIVVLFTRDFGKMRLVAKGARKIKNRFGASLEVLTHLRILFHEKENRDLLVLDRADILFSPYKRPTKLRTDYFLYYFAELVNEFYPEREKNAAAFRILSNIKRALEHQQDLEYVARYVELQLLHSQGILSSVAVCSQCSRPFESLLERRYLGVHTEIFCKRCRDTGSVALPVPIIKSMDSFERGSSGWANSLSGATLEELGSLNRLLITRFLGKNLRTYPFKKDFV